MRRTSAVAAIAASSALALTAGLLIALPSGAASAATAPTLISLQVSPSSVTTVGKYGADRKITVTAVYNDPDRVIRNVGFSNNGESIQNYSPKDFAPIESGARRTFAGDFRADFNTDPGTTKVYVEGQVGYGDLVPGTQGRTSYVVKNKPTMRIDPTTGLSIWGTKAKFYGHLSSTPDNANKKVRIDFDRKGKQKGKQWQKRQVVRTNADGLFFTKKFKINKEGRFRATFAGTTYVLPASDVWKVKRFR